MIKHFGRKQLSIAFKGYRCTSSAAGILSIDDGVIVARGGLRGEAEAEIGAPPRHHGRLAHADAP